MKHLNSQGRANHFLSQDMIPFTAALFAFLLMLFIFAPSSVYAGPALRDTNLYSQPDYTEFEAVLHGDENFSYYTKPDGTLIQKDPNDNFWKQLVLSGDGTFSFGVYADKDSVDGAADASVFENESMCASYYAMAGKSYNDNTITYSPDLVTLYDINPASDASSVPENSPSLYGVQKESALPLITIVVSFTDQEANKDYDWNNILYSGDESLSAYYSTASESKFTWAPAYETSAAEGYHDALNDGVIYVTLDRNHGNWQGNFSDNATATDMISAFKDAVKAASAYVDFKDYDTDGDGKLETNEAGLCFIIAGYETSTGHYYADNQPSIWAHAWKLDAIDEIPFYVDDTQLSNYITLGETWMIDHDNEEGEVTTKTMHAGIGTLAHELGHYLGLPDLYDTHYSDGNEWSLYDVSYVSIMCGGGWGSYDDEETFIPTSMDPYCRQLLGYISPTVITENGTYTANSENSESRYTAYRIDISKDEYYLIENRQYEGFDKGLQDRYKSGIQKSSNAEGKLDNSYPYTNNTGGIIIWHIDNGVCEERGINVETLEKQNTTNNTDHRPGVMPDYLRITNIGFNRPLVRYPFMNNAVNDILDITQIPLTIYDGSDYVKDIADTGISISVKSDASDDMAFSADFPDSVNSITPLNKQVNPAGETVEYTIECANFTNTPVLAVYDESGARLTDTWANVLCTAAWGGKYKGSIQFPENYSTYTINYTIHVLDGVEEADKTVFASASQGIRCDDVLKSGSEGSVFKIHSALRGVRMVDISGASTANGANAQIYTNNETAAQRFLFTYDDEGFYTIKNVYSGKVLDAAGGGKTNGTNVQQYVSNNTDAQKWVLYPVDGHEGYYCILNRASGLALDVAGGNADDGANLQLYSQNETAAQHFTFVTGLSDKINEDTSYSLISTLNSKKAADIAAASKANGGNLQLYNDNGTNAQKFSFKYDASTGYYTLINVNSSLVIDVAGGSKDNMANVWQYASNGTFAQKWAVVSNSDGTTITLINAGSGKALDIAGAQTANGTNIQQYTSNGTAAQKWELT